MSNQAAETNLSMDVVADLLAQMEIAIEQSDKIAGSLKAEDVDYEAVTGTLRDREQIISTLSSKSGLLNGEDVPITKSDRSRLRAKLNLLLERDQIMRTMIDDRRKIISGSISEVNSSIKAQNQYRTTSNQPKTSLFITSRLEG